MPFAHKATFFAALTLLGGFCVHSAQAQTSTLIANTFGPNESFTPSGVLIAGANNTFNTGFQSYANPFTPNGSFTFDEVDVAFSYSGFAANASTSDTVALSLQTSNPNGLPSGSILAQFPVNGVQGNVQQATKIFSASHPLLTSGQTYWLVATPTTSTTNVTWNYPSGNPTGPTAVDHGNGFSASKGQTAFSVYGTPAAVPESSTTVSLGLLLALGLGGIVLAKKRTRRSA